MRHHDGHLVRLGHCALTNGQGWRKGAVRIGPHPRKSDGSRTLIALIAIVTAPSSLPLPTMWPPCRFSLLPLETVERGGHRGSRSSEECRWSFFIPPPIRPALMQNGEVAIRCARARPVVVSQHFP